MTVVRVEIVPSAQLVVGFAANQLTQTILVPLRVEGGRQPAKTFSVILSNPRGGASLGTQSRATVTISATP